MPGPLGVITIPSVLLGVGFFGAALAMGGSASEALATATYGLVPGLLFGAVAFLLLYAFVDPRWIVGGRGEEEAQLVGDRPKTA